METSYRTGPFSEPTYGAPYDVFKKVPHIGHRQHLCDIVERGEVSLEQMKELVTDAKFICKTCGRVAAAEENLCEPEPLGYQCKTCGMTYLTKAELMKHAKKEHKKK